MRKRVQQKNDGGEIATWRSDCPSTRGGGMDKAVGLRHGPQIKTHQGVEVSAEPMEGVLDGLLLGHTVEKHKQDLADLNLLT